MNYMLPFRPLPLTRPIRYTDKILLTGSCFTEHMSSRLSTHKFDVLQNPHGILFNPISVAKSLESYLTGRLYTNAELFYLNELWNSWDHHTRFSHIDKAVALEGINSSQTKATAFIKNADWIVITLGSAFQYFLTEEGTSKSGVFNKPVNVQSDGKSGGVSNNHRAPAAWFRKELLEINVIRDTFLELFRTISHLNPKVRFLFTISPVRHVRDGIVENNRSKARLLEAVHSICESDPGCHYFPAYELVIDVLRDYRFYDIDLVHPNYAATETVWDAFIHSCISSDALPIMKDVKEITIARSHLPRFPETESHRKFLKSYAEKVASLATTYPFLNLAEEARYFNAAN